jgi:uncharacterized protein (DUF4415 family)
MSDNDFNNTSRTDWAALEAMDDEDIGYSGIPPLTDEFFENATLKIPATPAWQMVKIELDVLKWFQAQGGEYKALINSVLRRYIEKQGEHPAV